MPRTSAIRIKTEIIIPYTRDFGAASKAETLVMAIREAIGTAMNGTTAVTTKWSAEHTTVVTAEEKPAANLVSGPLTAPKHAAE